MQERALQLLRLLERDIDGNRLILPSLPEVALRVRELTISDSCTAQKLEHEIAKDAAIAARLLKVANSAALLRGVPVTSLKQAVMHLGFDLVRSMVTQLAILQTMQSGADKERLRGFVASGLQISALCHTLASRQPHLDAELAALGGLLHDIGKLPLRDFLLRQADVETAERLQFEQILHPYVGAIMLQRWQMTGELVQMARFHERIQRDSGNPKADYVDVVIAANLLHYGTDSGRYARYAGITIPALEKCTGGALSLDEHSTAERMELALALISA